MAGGGLNRQVGTCLHGGTVAVLVLVLDAVQASEHVYSSISLDCAVIAKLTINYVPGLEMINEHDMEIF